MQKISLMLAVLILSLTTAQAEVLSIAEPGYDLSGTNSDIPRPTQGMKMPQVEKQFGMPETKVPAVGDPPISRWSYGDFEVFFEYDKVIHSVLKRPKQP